MTSDHPEDQQALLSAELFLQPQVKELSKGLNSHILFVKGNSRDEPVSLDQPCQDDFFKDSLMIQNHPQLKHEGGRGTRAMSRPWVA